MGKKNLSLIDIIILGWYYILDKTIYFNGIEKGGLGAREHSFFITFLFIGINIYTIVSYISAKYFNVNLSLYLSLTFAILSFVIGYLVYFKKGRVNRIISYDEKLVKIILFSIIALTYVIISSYGMWVVGNYARYQLIGKD